MAHSESTDDADSADAEPTDGDAELSVDHGVFTDHEYLDVLTAEGNQLVNIDRRDGETTIKVFDPANPEDLVAEVNS